ncbi:molybdenum cofactor biosynthesis protein MoaE [Herbiconiux ginsengi]|uniref:Molybdopterin synthase subunit MoaE n=1 Tax=Herbiconiux ginsengi TaxID=381665 RepID=A0A1H3S9J1_9MICO|nr:molybdenum cofactor biosynthesis protein MoaE [Herbiconiux ginsengi]SDZ34736.1 molybdopterin synthase subunit MoaE [Herbiconiux ginsengi]
MPDTTDIDGVAPDSGATSGPAGPTPESERVVFARVSESGVSVEECAAAVEDAGSGAVVTFAGVVRDHDEGRGVVALSYSAHPSAAEVIRTVALEVARAHPAVRLAVAHRVGDLGIGDVALACAVASAHRAEAFAACAALVDEVKATVPIWKEQAFDDGTSEWVASLG